MTPKTTDVAIGVIVRKNRCLITRRPRGGHLEGLWEFPGGKFLPGEAAADCLHREVFEEVGLHIKIERPLRIVEHDYPDRRLRLHFFLCRMEGKDRTPGGALEIKWIPVEDLDQYSFPEANVPVLKLLRDLKNKKDQNWEDS